MIIRNVSAKGVYRPEKMGKADLISAGRLFAGLNGLEPGQEHAAHTHEGQDKIYYVLEGHGQVTIGETVSELGPDDMALARSGEEHSIKNTGATRLLVMVIMAPNPMKK